MLFIEACPETKTAVPRSPSRPTAPAPVPPAAGPRSSLTAVGCASLRDRLDVAILEEDIELLRTTLGNLLESSVSLSSLKESQLARLVKKKLARHPDDTVAHLGRQLVSKWSSMLVADTLHGEGVTSSAPTGPAHTWTHDDDVIVSVLTHCDAAALLELRACSHGWMAKVRAYGCTPAWLKRQQPTGEVDMTIALSRRDWALDAQLSLRAAPDATSVRVACGSRHAMVDVTGALGLLIWPKGAHWAGCGFSHYTKLPYRSTPYRNVRFDAVLLCGTTFSGTPSKRVVAKCRCALR